MADDRSVATSQLLHVTTGMSSTPSRPWPAPPQTAIVVAEETMFGLRELGPCDVHLVGAAYWRANDALPAGLLPMLTAPPVGVSR